MTGKLGNLLAAFESNIEKNKQHGPCKDGSFISGSPSPSASSTISKRRQSITYSQNISPMRDEGEDARIDYTVRWSPKKTPILSPTKRSSRTRLPASIVPPPFADDSESDISESVCSAKSQSSVSLQKSPEKKIRKVVVKRIIRKKKPDPSMDSKSSISQRMSRRSPGSSSRKSIVSPRRRRDRPASKTEEAYCSPTEETSSFESPNDETPQSQLVHTVQPDMSTEQNKNEKSVSSLPVISRNNSNTAGNVSFNSLPVIRPSKKVMLRSDRNHRKTRSSSKSRRVDKKEAERWSSDSSSSSLTPPRQVKKQAGTPHSPVPTKTTPKRYHSPIPTRTASKSCTLSPVPNMDKGGNDTFLTKRKVYPRSPFPNKGTLKASLATFDTSDDEDSKKPVVMHNAGSKTITVQHCISAKAPVESFPSDLSALSFETKPTPYPKSPSPLLRTDSGESSWSAGSTGSKSTGARPAFDCDPVHLLKLRDQPVGILLERNHVRNKTRRVKFADQQPGGGRRMSVESMSSRDSLPMRPRRSSLTHMDHLKAKKGFGGVLEEFAVTKIQATVRCWLLYKETKLVLLERKLIRIEQMREQELKTIQENKWKEMDKLRREIVENEKRLDSQVALGDKLIDHLKKDGALVKEQMKKLKEHIVTIQKNNEHLEQMSNHNIATFETMSTVIALLKEKSNHLEEAEKDYAKKTEIQKALVEESSAQVQRDITESKVLKQGIDNLVALISSRCEDKELVDEITMLSKECHTESMDALERSLGLGSSGMLDRSFGAEVGAVNLEKSYGSLISTNSSIPSFGASLDSKDFETAKITSFPSHAPNGYTTADAASVVRKVRPTLNNQTSGDSFADYCPSDLVLEENSFRIESIAEHGDE